MAFEAYLAEVGAPRRGTRRLIVVVSIAVHAVALAAAVAYSFWHVEELTPPVVTVTFISAAAPPPPPPPPAPLGGGGPAKRRVPLRPKTEPDTKPVEVAQPTKVEPPIKETPEPVKDEPHPTDKPGGGAVGSPSGDAAGVKGGVAGGVKGGVVGGTVGGAPTHVGAAPPKFLPPQMGAQQKLGGADPDFPALLRRAGASYVVMAKICVAPSGAVDSVTIQKRAEPTLDANVVSAVKTWRFRPLTANGAPIPFCYFGRFEFKSD